VAAATEIGFIAAASASNTAAAKAITTGTSSAAGWSIMAVPSTMAVAAVVSRGFAGKQASEIAGTLDSCTAFGCIVGNFRTRYPADSSIRQQTYL